MGVVTDEVADFWSRRVATLQGEVAALSSEVFALHRERDETNRRNVARWQTQDHERKEAILRAERAEAALAALTSHRNANCCQYQDAWRCAKHKGMTDRIACGCKCHKCSHKFIDSKCCLKCGWVPAPTWSVVSEREGGDRSVIRTGYACIDAATAAMREIERTGPAGRLAVEIGV